ncbi:MAG: DMT family transporter [Bacteroidota bacterium]
MRQFYALLTPGIKYMLFAALAFSSMHALVKSISYIHVFEVLFFRSSITSVICILYLKYYRISLIGNTQKWLLLRAAAGLVAMTLFFVTLQRMPMGASVSLKYLSPIFTAIFAVLFLKEKVRWVQWIFFLTALGGVFLMKGFDPRIDPVNLVLGITGAVFAGWVYVIIRKIGEREHSLVIVNYFMLIAAVLSGLAMIPFWQTPTPHEWTILVGIGILGCLGQIGMTKGFQLELASRVAPIRYMEIVYSLLIGLIWFDETYTVLSFLGIVLILGSMLANMLVKQSKS